MYNFGKPRSGDSNETLLKKFLSAVIENTGIVGSTSTLPGESTRLTANDSIGRCLLKAAITLEENGSQESIATSGLVSIPQNTSTIIGGFNLSKEQGDNVEYDSGYFIINESGYYTININHEWSAAATTGIASISVVNYDDNDVVIKTEATSTVAWINHASLRTTGSITETVWLHKGTYIAVEATQTTSSAKSVSVSISIKRSVFHTDEATKPFSKEKYLFLVDDLADDIYVNLSNTFPKWLSHSSRTIKVNSILDVNSDFIEALEEEADEDTHLIIATGRNNLTGSSVNIANMVDAINDIYAIKDQFNSVKYLAPIGGDYTPWNAAYADRVQDLIDAIQDPEDGIDGLEIITSNDSDVALDANFNNEEIYINKKDLTSKGHKALAELIYNTY